MQQGHLYYLRLLFCLLFETVMIIQSVVLCVLVTLAINVFSSCFFFTKRKEKNPLSYIQKNVTPGIFLSKLKAFKQMITLLRRERGLSISIIRKTQKQGGVIISSHHKKSWEDLHQSKKILTIL